MGRVYVRAWPPRGGADPRASTSNTAATVFDRHRRRVQPVDDSSRHIRRRRHVRRAASGLQSRRRRQLFGLRRRLGVYRRGSKRHGLRRRRILCLPEKPVTRCMQPSTNPNERVPGSWRWTGWMGTNKQAWTCACPYASFYPMDTTPNADTAGACLRSSNVCRGGTWTYPCKHPIRCDSTTCSLDLDSCETLTPDERNALVGADMWEFGHCACKPGDRVELDASTGVPICVPDTCSTLLRCTETTPCPGSATCVAGSCVRATSSCTEDSDCGDAGTCLEGTCTWGKWRTLPIVPYVFGACECPRACVSRGTRCEC